MKCREKLRRWGSPLTCLCPPQNQMVSILFILTLSYSSPHPVLFIGYLLLPTK